MVDKRFSFMHSVLFGFLATIMIVVSVLLFVEYRFFCSQVTELIALKQQYAQCVNVLTKKINGDVVDDVLVTSEVVDEMLDEVPDELVEESPIAMDEIMAAEASDDPDADDDYADAPVVIPQQKKPVIQKKPIVRSVNKQKETKIAAMRRPIKDCGFIWPI